MQQKWGTKQKQVIPGRLNLLYHGQHSPKQARVEYKKYLNKVNETLQSLITAGKLKRNQLMSINNRALFNRGKVQRCEWMNRKNNSNHTSFFPDVSNLNLDTRSPEAKNKHKMRRYYTETKNSGRENDDDQLLNSLIDEQIQVMKKKGYLEKGMKSKDIVQEACREIQKTIIENYRPNPKVQPPKSRLKSIYNIKKDSNHRRSVTDIIYKQELQKVERREQIKTKQRLSGQKNFLRRIRNITLPSS